MDRFRDLLPGEERIGSVFDEAFSGSREMVGDLSKGTWLPAVDIYERENDFVLKAELPGIDRKDIVIEVKENILILKGKRMFHRDLKEENYYRMERSYGTFHRTFNLPNNIQNEKVGAKFKDGILEIILPKEETGGSDIINVDVE